MLFHNRPDHQTLERRR
ncbi:hypothetical protein Ga0076813_14771, partial [endosymbiont of Ridgeia piscesae]